MQNIKAFGKRFNTLITLAITAIVVALGIANGLHWFRVGGLGVSGLLLTLTLFYLRTGRVPRTANNLLQIFEFECQKSFIGSSLILAASVTIPIVGWIVGILTSGILFFVTFRLVQEWYEFKTDKIRQALIKKGILPKDYYYTPLHHLTFTVWYEGRCQNLSAEKVLAARVFDPAMPVAVISKLQGIKCGNLHTLERFSSPNGWVVRAAPSTESIAMIMVNFLNDRTAIAIENIPLSQALEIAAMFRTKHEYFLHMALESKTQELNVLKEKIGEGERIGENL